MVVHCNSKEKRVRISCWLWWWWEHNGGPILGCGIVGEKTSLGSTDVCGKFEQVVLVAAGEWRWRQLGSHHNCIEFSLIKVRTRAICTI